MALLRAFGAPSRPKAGGRNGPHGLARVGRPFRARRPDSARCRRAPPGVAPTFALRALVTLVQVGSAVKTTGRGACDPTRLLHGIRAAWFHCAPKARPPVEDGFARPSNLSVDGKVLASVLTRRTHGGGFANIPPPASGPSSSLVSMATTKSDVSTRSSVHNTPIN